MKKIIALAMALALLFTAALAEDLSSLSDTELMEFYRRVGEEGEHRGLREKQEILDCVNRFFSCWFAGNTEGMLNVCSSEWMSSAEDPGEELLGILGNRKPLNLTLGEVSGEYGDDFRIVSCRVIMDNNDGRGPGEAAFRIEVTREEDEKWYMDPTCVKASVKDQDLAALSDEELEELAEGIREEMGKRSLTADEDISAPLVRFFGYWSASDMDSMLELCGTEWKKAAADPRTELFRILANRIPRDMEIKNMDGDPADTSRVLTIHTTIDRQNGKEPQLYLFQVTMVRERDGKWYVDPRGLNPTLAVEDELPVPEVTPVPDAGLADTVLYYVPEGGEKYHVDPNCPTVNDKFTPMQGTFLYSQLNDEPYSGLRPCPVCGAPER